MHSLIDLRPLGTGRRVFAHAEGLTRVVALVDVWRVLHGQRDIPASMQELGAL